jgi:hypothetical protein
MGAIDEYLGLKIHQNPFDGEFYRQRIDWLETAAREYKAAWNYYFGQDSIRTPPELPKDLPIPTPGAVDGDEDCKPVVDALDRICLSLNAFVTQNHAQQEANRALIVGLIGQLQAIQGELAEMRSELGTANSLYVQSHSSREFQAKQWEQLLDVLTTGQKAMAAAVTELIYAQTGKRVDPGGVGTEIEAEGAELEITDVKTLED